MSGIIFQRTYHLGELHESVKQRADQYLSKYLAFANIYDFDDKDKVVTFSTERLIPDSKSDRPKVMFLFSNPHPHSVYQGMFLSPNTRGRESDFWRVMEDAGLLSIPKENRSPNRLEEICLNADYPGPFAFIFYCYYVFPTGYPKEIRQIFGKKYFNDIIQPEAKDEFRKMLEGTNIEAVVVFNKEVFNQVAREGVQRCIDRLKAGELIRSEIEGIERSVPVFLTFPTGWRYHSKYRQLRKDSLESIHQAIMA
jgi:hypothetical protein